MKGRYHTAGLLVASAFVVSFVGPQPARAGFSLGEAANFAVLYEGNKGNELQFNTSSIVDGNIGIGCGVTSAGATTTAPCSSTTTGKFDGSGPGTITGTVEFEAANYGGSQLSDSGLNITGGVTYDAASSAGTTNSGYVYSGLNTVNALSKSLGNEAGKALTINTNNQTHSQSLTASSGTLDASGDDVFTTTVSSFAAGTTLTITGTSSQYVVLNVSGTANFDGRIVLSGGITSDHVLINIDAGNYSTLTGGQTLTIDANCSSQSCATSGTFLDPNGDIQINTSVIDGRVFGGDTQDISLMCGAAIYEPTAYTPEPSYYVLMGLSLTMVAVAYRRKSIRSQEATPNPVL
ncbi:MAG: hypothetical protein ABSB15_18605 [Bryobacteraceae bacterium]|jgi:hypothetical protein